MSVVVVQNLSGLEQWARAQDAGLADMDWTPAVRQCAVAIRADALINFDTSSGPDGQAWAPLSTLTMSLRRGNGANAKPLQDRGLLMAAVTGGGPNSVEEITSHSCAVGVNNLVYAATHQFGAVIRPRSAGALAIPLTPQARRVGSPLKYPGGLTRIGQSLYPTGRKPRQKPKAQYLLLAQVKIPARPFLGFGSRLQTTLDNILGDFVERFGA